MNAPLTAPAAEINRLHGEVQRLTTESRQALHAALAAAWQAGQLLLAEKARVRGPLGAGGWHLWLEQNFRGSRRTAQNYMRLARSVADLSFLQGLSLRQAYLKLGIATEPKHRTETAAVRLLPPHVRLAQRLLAALPSRRPAGKTERDTALRQDLRALYERLRQLYAVCDEP
jgi:hypothetical protein